MTRTFTPPSNLAAPIFDVIRSSCDFTPIMMQYDISNYIPDYIVYNYDNASNVLFFSPILNLQQSLFSAEGEKKKACVRADLIKHWLAQALITSEKFSGKFKGRFKVSHTHKPCLVRLSMQHEWGENVCKAVEKKKNLSRGR